MQAGVAIQVLPQGACDTDETVAVVDCVIAYIKERFPDAFVGPFETTIEGGYDECMETLAECGRIAARESGGEVAVFAKIFYSPTTGVLTTGEKVGKYHEGGL